MESGEKRWTGRVGLCIATALTSIVLQVPTACHTTPRRHPGGWFILRWVEKPSSHGPSKRATADEQIRFDLVMAFDRNADDATFEKAKAALREGDLIAFWMNPWEARKRIATGDLAKLGYRLLEYGHLGILVKDPADPTRLRLFSSVSRKGPNIDDDLDSFRRHDWDCYRMDKWDRVDTNRLHDFVALAIRKAGNKHGYDFSGVFGLWNSNLEPSSPEQIGHEYICSTTVAAALFYCGVDLDAVQRHGLIDVVTPKQVVTGKGRLIRPADVTLEIETGSPE